MVRGGVASRIRPPPGALGVPLDLLAPVIYSEKKANPAKFAKNQKYIADLARKRGLR
jgi:hypothetical protein